MRFGSFTSVFAIAVAPAAALICTGLWWQKCAPMPRRLPWLCSSVMAY